jgi:hypothetical protein
MLNQGGIVYETPKSNFVLFKIIFGQEIFYRFVGNPSPSPYRQAVSVNLFSQTLHLSGLKDAAPCFVPVPVVCVYGIRLHSPSAGMESRGL